VADYAVLDMVGRLLLAALLGALLGAERESVGQDAGLRTHLLLALGAALFGLISVGAWDHFAAERASTNFQVDVTRVASYVAAGIGFLGGGAIIKHGGGVRGLTTASSLWVAAAVGLACGVGFWVPALTATGAGLVSLVALRPVRSLVRRYGKASGSTVVVKLEHADGFGELARAVSDELPMTPAEIRAGPAQAGSGFEVAIDFTSHEPGVLLQCAEVLSRLDGVQEVHIGR
jgi:putative Mg2+ transporter-C (MgtC) family protein